MQSSKLWKTEKPGKSVISMVRLNASKVDLADLYWQSLCCMRSSC